MTQGFNQRLNDLTQIMNATVSAMMSTSSEVDREITQYNNQIQEKQQKLDEQNQIITSNEAGMKIKKDMVKYTEEKARNTNNLLKMYCFLNVVTLGLLVYVYKAAGDS
jgi:peptidoglycan hydrolase CwlO-like protein